MSAKLSDVPPILFEVRAIPPFPMTPTALVGFWSNKYQASINCMQSSRFWVLIGSWSFAQHFKTPENMTATISYALSICASVRFGKFSANLKSWRVMFFVLY
jgi:hypothetical protein